MKRIMRALLTLALGLVFLVPAGASAHPAPYCGIVWGSLAKADRDTSAGASITNVRTGRHACYDRMVVDVRGDVEGYSVRYVDQVRAEGTGNVVPVRGGARLEVVANAPTYNANGVPTYRPANPRELSNVSGFSTFRQIASAGSFEGQSTFALGVRARLPFRVFILDGPGTGTRLVVDVAHRW
ncbi:AMIN-like domain-containing (lipo)protein [Georgenia faecalis]|uniref:AMIN-like domain-containing protein n=1 Tax=Georgenia faecalis TaxID=2483799 RepID=A0ABV9DB74_9MICO|nr:hypothetical protein [Georgenia faecalis]